MGHFPDVKPGMAVQPASGRRQLNFIREQEMQDAVTGEQFLPKVVFVNSQLFRCGLRIEHIGLHKSVERVRGNRCRQRSRPNFSDRPCPSSICAGKVRVYRFI